MSSCPLVNLNMARYKNSKILKLIGERIHNHRVKKELEIEDIAEMTGFSYNTISNIESGCETYLSYFIEVCLAIGIHPMEMLDLNIIIKPRYELSPSRKEKSRLTSRIRILIKTGYFKIPRKTRDVVKELNTEYNLNVASKDVSTILGRLLKSSKKGNHKIYYE